MGRSDFSAKRLRKFAKDQAKGQSDDAKDFAQDEDAVHVAAGDPHSGYRLESADHSHESAGAQAGKLDHGLAHDGLLDDDHTQYALADGSRVISSIKTDAPAGGTSGTWKLGVSAAVSPTAPDRTIEVDIGGTIFYIHAKTTND